MVSSSIEHAVSELVDEFHTVHGQERLEFLIEYGDDLPDLRSEFDDAPESGERVEECQSPVVLYTSEPSSATDAVTVDITVPPSAPVTRGFAAILQQLADGRPASDMKDIPGDLTDQLGLSQLVSPLRLTGMAALVGRLQRRAAAAC